MGQEDDSSKGDLKDWVLKEMVSGREEDQSMVATTLNEHKEAVRKFLIIRENGMVTLRNYRISAKAQVLAYIVGAAYAKVAEVRKDDSVNRVELVKELGLKAGTVDPTLKALREQGSIMQKDPGVYRVNYTSLDEIMGEIPGSLHAKPEPRTGAIFDPFLTLHQEGPAGLRGRLDRMDSRDLKILIRKHKLDTTGRSNKWNNVEKLSSLAYERLLNRQKHGQVFMAGGTGSDNL